MRVAAEAFLVLLFELPAGLVERPGKAAQPLRGLSLLLVDHLAHLVAGLMGHLDRLLFRLRGQILDLLFSLAGRVLRLLDEIPPVEIL